MHAVQRYGLSLSMFRGLCVCPWHMSITVSCAKTDEPTEMPFSVWTRVGPGNHILGMRPRPPRGRGNFKGRPPAMPPYIKLLTTCLLTVRSGVQETVYQIPLRWTDNCGRYCIDRKAGHRCSGRDKAEMAACVINKSIYPGNWLVRHRRRRRRESCARSRHRSAVRRGSSWRAAVPPRWWTFGVNTRAHSSTRLTAENYRRSRIEVRPTALPRPRALDSAAVYPD